MGLPDADAATQIEPSMLGIRVAGKFAGDVEGFFCSRNLFKILEGMASEPVQIREAAQCFALPLGLLRKSTFTVDETAEVRVANGDLHAHPPRVLADRTAPGRGCCRRSIAAGWTDRDGEGGEDIANAFHIVSRWSGLAVPLARFSSLGLPSFQNALDVAPGALVIGD